MTLEHVAGDLMFRAASRVADGVHFPNGFAMTPGGTLVVAETLGQRLTAFDVGEDGGLGAPRPWATFAPEPSAGSGVPAA